MQNHFSIEPVDGFVSASYLYQDNNRSEVLKCQVVGFCVYKDEALTLDIVLEDGSAFNYIPPHHVRTKEGTKGYKLEELVYHNAPGIYVTVTELPFFKGTNDSDNNHCYIKQRSEWVKFKYICTIDWYKGNYLLHMVILENGQFAFMPNHKLKFNPQENANEFQKFSKLRETWKV